MLERMMLFLLGGGGYLGIELAWRGTSHWTMFLAGGLCLCMLQALAVRPVSLPLAAVAGAAAVSGLEVCIGWPAERCCTSPYGTTATNGATWPG